LKRKKLRGKRRKTRTWGDVGGKRDAFGGWRKDWPSFGGGTGEPRKGLVNQEIALRSEGKELRPEGDKGREAWTNTQRPPRDNYCREAKKRHGDSKESKRKISLVGKRTQKKK